MNEKNREENVTKLQGYLKNATITVHEIEEILLSQEHIIWMQQREIDDLKKRLKSMENLDIQSEQILYLQNMTVQLKTQIEFLKSQIQEKDQIIGQITIKPIKSQSAEIIQTQQHLVQQNLQLQNIIGELQNQILSKDNVISSLKQQENTLDSLIGQLQISINNKNKKVAKESANGPLKELQKYPDALSELIERIMQQQNVLENLIDEKDKEIARLNNDLNLKDKNRILQEENQFLQNQIDKLSSQYKDSQNQLQESILQVKLITEQLSNCQQQIQSNEQANLLNQSNHDELVSQHIKLDDLNSELEIKLAEKNQIHSQLSKNVANLEDQIIALGNQIQNKNLNLIELQLEKQQQDALQIETQTQIQNLQKENKQLQQEQKELSEQIFNIRQEIETFDIDLLQKQNELQSQKQVLEKLNDELNSISLQEKEELLKQKQKYLNEQLQIKSENQLLQQQVEVMNQKQEEIIKTLNEHKNQINKRQAELDEQQQIGKEIEHFYHSITAQQEEMEFQIKEKNEQLDKLNDQFTKVDEEVKIMESVIQLKQKELQQLKQKKESYIKDLDQENQDLLQVKKRIGKQRKQQQRSYYEEEQFDLEEEIQDKLVNLHQKKSTLQQDVQRMVEQSPEILEQVEKVDTSVSQFNQQIVQDAIKEREKRIAVLELTIQSLQQQNQEKSVNHFQQQQPRSIIIDEDPLLIDLQAKFIKESELLQDLQNKLKSTAERHYQLSIKLQEWAEKESKLAGELDFRIKSVELLESELQVVFNKQSDKESEKVQILERIYHVETEINDLFETELSTKNKLKEKKDYIQVLYKNLVDMDQKLLQLRNRMALYSQEGRLLAEQVENLENEKENKQNALISIKEDLEQIEQDKKEKKALIESIKKEINDSQEQKNKLELQFAIVHSKNLQMKSQIGFEETLYQKLLNELETLKKKDQIQYQNVFSEGCTQTEYDLDQFEGLLKVTQFFRSTQEDVLNLKQNCQQQLASIYDKESEQIQKALQVNQSFKRIIHLQQMLILCQENENSRLVELNSGRSSNLVFRSCEVSTQSSQYTLEQIDPLLNKTTVVEIQLNEYSLIIGDQKIARQWILDKSFDYNNPFYPLGVLYIIYKVSIYQIINIALTGSKVLQLWQTLL